MWAWFLPDPGIFAKLPFHGNTSWTPIPLVVLGLCLSWSDARSLTEAFTQAADACRTLYGQPALGTYQGVMGALVTWTSRLLPLLVARLRECMEAVGGPHYRIAGWLPIAIDGSRTTTPRTKSNEAAYCAANYGKGKTAKYRKKKSKGLRRKKNKRNKTQPPKPQTWITLMMHMSLRLPWAWRIGPSDASEREHALEMIRTEKFPRNTLFCGDAGFVGRPFWHAILEQKQNFLVRVGANVHLILDLAKGQRLTKRRDQVVLCWPKGAMRSGEAPLRLRLIQTKVGKTKMGLLTSVLDGQDLTVEQAVRFYEMRWGVEVAFRGLKQTLNRSKLRCRIATRVQVELDWSILGMAVAELFAWKEQQPAGIDPVKRSLATTMGVLRGVLRNLHATPPAGESLSARLRAAVTDDAERTSSKRARYRPRNPDKKKLGAPKLRRLTAEERQKLHKIHPPAGP